jgi:hypothetical protein
MIGMASRATKACGWLTVIGGLLAMAMADGGCGDDAKAPAVDASQDSPVAGGASGTGGAGGVGAAGADGATATDAVDVPAFDAGATDTTGNDSGAAIPLECQVPMTTRTPPYQLVFRLRNAGAVPVFLRQGCVGVEFDISSCGSRYSDSLGPRYLCACPCSDATCTGAVACGPCPQPAGVEIAPGASKDVTWIASQALSEDRGSFQCANRPALPAARYGLSVPLFASATEAANNAKPLRVARRSFELPAAGDLVEVPLAAPPTDGGAAPTALCQTTPAQTPPVCAAPFRAEVVCGLDGTYTLARVGGSLVAAQDDAVIMPNGATTLTRKYLDLPGAPQMCTTQLSVCGAAQDRFTTAVFMEALAAPDVVTAFAAPPFKLYGEDARAYDGQVARIQRADGMGLMVGPPCRNNQLCGAPLTPGLAHLAAVVDKIDRQLRADPACAALPY